jgi:hypothetical protein
MPGWRGFRGVTERQNVRGDAFAEALQVEIHPCVHFRGQRAAQPRAQEAIVQILVPQARSVLMELGHYP